MPRKDDLKSNGQKQGCYEHYPGSDGFDPERLRKYNADHGDREKDPCEEQIHEAEENDDHHKNSDDKSPGTDPHEGCGKIEYIELPHYKACCQHNEQYCEKYVFCPLVHFSLLYGARMSLSAL